MSLRRLLLAALFPALLASLQAEAGLLEGLLGRVPKGPNVDGDYLRPGLTTAELLRGRGYRAEQHYVTTADGYILSLVRGSNPLLAGSPARSQCRVPVLFIHGIFNSAPVFMINSAGAEPKDFSSINISSSSVEQLMQQVGSDPSARSLALLALNFGCDVWLLNRRGSLESEAKVGHLNRSLAEAVLQIPATFLSGGLALDGGLLPRPVLARRERSAAPRSRLRRQVEQTADKNLLVSSLPFTNLPAALLDFGNLIDRFIKTFDVNFWNYSLDQQAANDFPEVIEYILNETGARQLSLVSHSAGGATVLLGLADQPQLADKSECRQNGWASNWS